jgi:hypothetical protein
MKTVLILLSFSLLIFTLGMARPRQHASESCGFTVQGEPGHPTVTGPDDIVPLVYVVEQPDSPVEVVSVDLAGMWLSVSHEQHTERDCAKYRIRNRSDRTVQDFEIMLMLSTIAGAGGGSGTGSSSPLSPGQTVDVDALAPHSTQTCEPISRTPCSQMKSSRMQFPVALIELTKTFVEWNSNRYCHRRYM